MHTYIHNNVLFLNIQKSQSVLKRSQVQLDGSNVSNLKIDSELELDAMPVTAGQGGQDNLQNQGSQLPEILVREVPESGEEITHEEEPTKPNTDDDNRPSLPDQPTSAAASYRGLHRNNEPTHSFIRTVSKFYHQKK